MCIESIGSISPRAMRATAASSLVSTSFAPVVAVGSVVVVDEIVVGTSVTVVMGTTVDSAIDGAAANDPEVVLDRLHPTTETHESPATAT
jgi:hypothetical protein